MGHSLSKADQTPVFVFVFFSIFFYVLCLCALAHSVAGTCLVRSFMKDLVGSQLSSACLPWSPWDQSRLSREKESLDFNGDFHLPPAPLPPYRAESEDFLFLPGPPPSRNWSFPSEITHKKSLPRFAVQCLSLFHLETLTSRGQQTASARGHCL